MAKLSKIIEDRRQSAEDYLRTKRGLWTEYENILHGYLNDDISGKTRSEMFDPKLPTIALDRSARVMSQLPTGKVRGISKNDKGAEELMNLIHDKYIIPNANAQFDFLTKSRMVNLYSNVYGNFFTLIDWDVKPNGYVGPDLWLVPIRNVFPQVGAVSIEDSDYIIIRSWKPKSYFENLKKEKGYKNVGKILDALEETSGSKDTRDQDQKSARENVDFPDEKAAKKSGFYEVLSMYERDRWVDYSVDAQMEFRDIENPHEDGDLPVKCKYSIPLLDDFMGMGDFERGKPMQYGINSLWNLYLDAVKVSIFPPVLVDEDRVSDMSSVKWAAAAKWLMKNGGAVNGARSLQLSPQGISTFNQVYGSMNASLLNMFGTTDTTTTPDTDPGFGKTPQALKMQAVRENARDTVDRFYQERWLTSVGKKMINLVSKKMSSSIAVRLFGDEIEKLENIYPEVNEMFDEDKGKLTVPKDKFGKMIWDYEIVPGSTFAADKDKQQQSLLELFTIVTKDLQVNPQTGEVTSPLLQAMKKEQKSVMFGELITRIVNNAGTQDWDKIIIDTKDDIKGKMMQDRQKLMQAIQGMMANNVNQVPAQPNQPQQPQGIPVEANPLAQGIPNG